MSEVTATVGGADAIVSVPVITPAETDNTPISATEAARQLSSYRWKRDNPEEGKAEPSAPESAAATPQESAETPTGDPENPAPAATTEAEPEPALPTIEPPGSWTKDEKAEFATYPREAQEKIARREQERDSALRRSQNEAAEKLKGLTAKEQQAEQARQQYEAALPALLQTLQDKQQGEFSDIRTIADLQHLASNDPFRFAQYQAKQMEIGAVHQEVQKAQERKKAEFSKQWSDFATKQDQMLADKAPELADKARSQKVAESAVNVLKDIGFDEGELAKAWNGEAGISLRDHRVQLLILDAIKYREAKSGVAKPAAKPIPNVQRPGASKAQLSAADANVEELTKRFERTGSVKDAAALRAARQRAANS